MDTMEKMGGVVLLMVLILTGLSVLWGLPLMLLWNWLMPTLFGLTKITFWQAVGLNVMCVILFKGSGTSYSTKK